MPVFKSIAEKVKLAHTLQEHGPEAGKGSDGVKVTVRVRPFIKEEFARGVDSEPKLCIDMSTKQDMEITDDIGKKSQFSFDRVYWSHSADHPLYATQDTLYNELGVAMLEHALCGFNTCIFAYGQTGSGKSYSVLGSNSQDGRGLLPRIVEGVFDKFGKACEGHKNSCTVSFLEIYNENIYDLLVPCVDEDEKKKDLKVRLHPVLGAQVVGLESFQVSSLSEVMNLVETGMRKRAVGATAMNFNSSRSHCIFTMRTSCEGGNGIAKMSQTHLVDLAGSERAGRTGAQGARLKEGAAINQSLSTLARVISTLAERASSKSRKTPPFRDSKLTYILKESLCGNSKTYMMAAISPSLLDFEETMSTLRFAQSAKKVQLTPMAMEVNAGNERAIEKQLRAELANLKEQLAACKMVRAVDLMRFKERQRILNQQHELCNYFAHTEDDLDCMEKPQVESSGLADLLDSSEDEEDSLVECQSSRADIDVEELKAELSEANQRLKLMEHETHSMKDYQDVKRQLEEEKENHKVQKNEHADLRAELEAALLQERKTVDKLTLEIAANNSERVELQTSMQTKTSELDTVMANLKDAQEQIESRTGELDEMTSEIQSLQMQSATHAAKRASRTRAFEMELSSESKQQEETRSELKFVQCELADAVTDRVTAVRDELQHQIHQAEHNFATWAAHENELESEIASQAQNEVLLQEELRMKKAQLDSKTVELKNIGAQFDAATTELNCVKDEARKKSLQRQQDVAACCAQLQEELRIKSTELDASTVELNNVRARFDAATNELNCLEDQTEKSAHEYQQDAASWDMREMQLKLDNSYLLGQHHANKERTQQLQQAHMDFRNLTAQDLKDQLAATLKREQLLNARLEAIAVAHEKAASSISRAEADAAVLREANKHDDSDLGVRRQLQLVLSNMDQGTNRNLFSCLFCGSRSGRR